MECIMLEIKDYIRNRVDDQITWYDKKSLDAQKNYKRIQIAEIISAAAIPVLVPYVASCGFISFLVAALGALIAVLEGLCRLHKFHENWIQYRTTAELLKYHKYLYQTNSAPYNTQEETTENLFVRNIEAIISSENNTWKALNTNTKQEADKA